MSVFDHVVLLSHTPKRVEAIAMLAGEDAQSQVYLGFKGGLLQAYTLCLAPPASLRLTPGASVDQALPKGQPFLELHVLGWASVLLVRSRGSLHVLRTPALSPSPDHGSLSEHTGVVSLQSHPDTHRLFLASDSAIEVYRIHPDAVESLLSLPVKDCRAMHLTPDGTRACTP